MIEEIKNKKFENSKEENLNNLKQIIKENSNTEYGSLHNFSLINCYEDYKTNVPISDYSNYSEYVYRMYNGEKNVLTAYDVLGYCETSGTTNKPKLIPFSSKALEKYGCIIDNFKSKLIKNYRKKNGKGHRLFIHTIQRDINDGFEKCNLITEVLYLDLFKNNKIDENEYAGGLHFIFNSENENYFYSKLWIAILDEDIIILEGIFAYEMIRFFTFFEENYEQIISDISMGIIPEDRNISEKTKKKLLSLPISKERLEFVKSECEKGFKGIVKRIWPNMQCIVSMRVKSSINENNLLDKYCEGINHAGFFFLMSECLIGLPFESNRFDYTFKTSSAFYELMEYNENETNGKVILLSEAKIGTLYEIVLTNFSGFYRYRTGDIIKIVDEHEGIPTFEFVFRKNIKINIVEERTTELHLQQVIGEISKVIPNIDMYSFGATYLNGIGTYFLLLAMDMKNSDINIDNIEDVLEDALCKINYTYKVTVKEKCLGKPKVIFLRKEDYFKCLNIGSAKKKHEKSIHILPKERLDQILSERFAFNLTKNK